MAYSDEEHKKSLELRDKILGLVKDLSPQQQMDIVFLAYDTLKRNHMRKMMDSPFKDLRIEI